MNKFTKKEQLGLLKRGLERRIIGANPAIKEKESEIKKITKVRNEFIDRIEKYKDDQVIVDMLNSQLKQYDRQFAGAKQNYIMAIEEIKASEPVVKRTLKYIEKIEKDKVSGYLLYLLLELFFRPILTDWHEMEEDMKQEKDKEKVKKDNGQE